MKLICGKREWLAAFREPGRTSDICPIVGVERVDRVSA